METKLQQMKQPAAGCMKNNLIILLRWHQTVQRLIRLTIVFQQNVYIIETQQVASIKKESMISFWLSFLSCENELIYMVELKTRD